MATKKSTGSSRNGRDSKSKNLGIKKFGGENVMQGCIIVRQRGTRVYPGSNVGIGKDYTIYAKKNGLVLFRYIKDSKKMYVDVI